MNEYDKVINEKNSRVKSNVDKIRLDQRENKVKQDKKRCNKM